MRRKTQHKTSRATGAKGKSWSDLGVTAAVHPIRAMERAARTTLNGDQTVNRT
jgi:hypothetical protein